MFNYLTYQTLPSSITAKRELFYSLYFFMQVQLSAVEGQKGFVLIFGLYFLPGIEIEVATGACLSPEGIFVQD